jgi:hypothetical protein
VVLVAQMDQPMYEAEQLVLAVLAVIMVAAAVALQIAQAVRVVVKAQLVLSGLSGDMVEPSRQH